MAAKVKSLTAFCCATHGRLGGMPFGRGSTAHQWGGGVGKACLVSVLHLRWGRGRPKSEKTHSFLFWSAQAKDKICDGIFLIRSCRLGCFPFLTVQQKKSWIGKCTCSLLTWTCHLAMILFCVRLDLCFLSFRNALSEGRKWFLVMTHNTYQRTFWLPQQAVLLHAKICCASSIEFFVLYFWKIQQARKCWLLGLPTNCDNTQWFFKTFTDLVLFYPLQKKTVRWENYSAKQETCKIVSISLQHPPGFGCSSSCVLAINSSTNFPVTSTFWNRKKTRKLRGFFLQWQCRNRSFSECKSVHIFCMWICHPPKCIFYDFCWDILKKGKQTETKKCCTQLCSFQTNETTKYQMLRNVLRDNSDKICTLQIFCILSPFQKRRQKCNASERTRPQKKDFTLSQKLFFVLFIDCWNANRVRSKLLCDLWSCCGARAPRPAGHGKWPSKERQ